MFAAYQVFDRHPYRASEGISPTRRFDFRSVVAVDSYGPSAKPEGEPDCRVHLASGLAFGLYGDEAARFLREFDEFTTALGEPAEG